MAKSIEEALAATTTNDMSLEDLLLYYQRPYEYEKDNIGIEDMIKDLRAIAAILLGEVNNGK